MIVQNLIEQLQKYPSDMVVVLSSDGEGNSYSPLADISTGLYEPDTTWSGEFSSYQYDEDDNETLIPESEHNALALWPTN